MKRLVLAAVLSASFAAFAAPESYTLDPTHTLPNFAIGHFGMSTVYGRFERPTGKVTLDRAAKTGSIEVKIPTATISSGDGKRADGQRSRDEHLRAADFFNSAEFPTLTFKSTKVVFGGELPAGVEGNLTLLGVTRPVALSFERFKCGKNPFNQKDRCGGNAVGKFKRSDFGMKTALPAVGDEITLNIEFEGDRD